MSPRRARWVAGAVAALAVVAALVVWSQWPRGPEPVVAGTVDAPAEYGQEFRVVSDDGEVRSGTVLGVTEVFGSTDARCYQVVGVLHWWQDTLGGDSFHGLGVQLLSSEGLIDPEIFDRECAVDSFRRDAELLDEYGGGFWDGEPDVTGLFYYGFAVPPTANVQAVVISGEPNPDLLLEDENASVFEFRVTRTLDEDGVAQ